MDGWMHKWMDKIDRDREKYERRSMSANAKLMFTTVGPIHAADV